MGVGRPAGARILWAVLVLLVVLTPALDLARNEGGSPRSSGAQCPLHANPVIGATCAATAPLPGWHPLPAPSASRLDGSLARAIFVPPRPTTA